MTSLVRLYVKTSFAFLLLGAPAGRLRAPSR